LQFALLSLLHFGECGYGDVIRIISSFGSVVCYIALKIRLCSGDTFLQLQASSRIIACAFIPVTLNLLSGIFKSANALFEIRHALIFAANDCQYDAQYRKGFSELQISPASYTERLRATTPSGKFQTCAHTVPMTLSGRFVGVQKRRQPKAG
jgi:hypothetical protein